ncbi:DUF5058 family protein [Acetonema longum]|uniref:DUF5058 family protein n=1 Tax=Acetonema longum DSM 6540 TaxID=1009370 RepID=F7NKQ8_9FIRM|nr:DUF5058 family protein [Acetonema longum]EGO63362.1 hypothetical protein ALO_13384 [Acetonema longum DSM 6540]
MDLQPVINSPGMWLASSIMVIVVVAQSFLYLREGFRGAAALGIPRSECVKGLRAAMITAIGPSLAPVVILLALLAVLGAPTTWMRMNDIGAARTELAMSALATKVYGVEIRSAGFDLKTFSYAIWGMALNNAGWMVVALIFVKRMNNAIKKMNEKYDPRWIKLLMTGAAIGLFAYLWSGSLIRGGGNLFAGIVSFIAMFLLSKYAGKYPRLQEPALGIAMLIGMFAAAAFF